MRDRWGPIPPIANTATPAVAPQGPPTSVPGPGTPPALDDGKYGPAPHPNAWAAMNEVMARLVELEHGRQALTDQLWSMIPAYVAEAGYQAQVTSLVVPGTSGDWVAIERATVTLPDAATGLLTLGEVTIPVGQGLTSVALTPGMLLAPTDLRQLSSTVSGPMSMLLTGRKAPTRGVLR